MHDDDDDGDSDVYELLFKKTCVREVGSSIQRLGSCIYVYIYIYIRERERDTSRVYLTTPFLAYTVE